MLPDHMPRAIVLGSGMVGSIMAADLAEDGDWSVTIADRSADALRRAQRRCKGRTHVIEADLSDPEAVKRIVAPFDIVLGALASAIGFQTLRAVIEAGKPYCDISFMPENALDLDQLAKERDVTAVVDCGVAPGMSNLLAGFGAATLETCDRIAIYVGGLPRDPKPPYLYKAAFSPADVLEEYTRPARIVEDGSIVTREALSEPERIEFGGVGTLEAFNTDGLRSLAYTMPHVPHMKEKTLRWPGHIDIMRHFRELGLFGHDPIQAGNASVRPIDLTSALLFPKWSYEPGEEDFTVMRVTVEGKRNGSSCRLSWDLLDEYDRASGATSMARTTAFPCTILARMLLDGDIDAHGVHVPEMIGCDARRTQHVLDELQRHGVQYHFREEPLVPPAPSVLV